MDTRVRWLPGLVVAGLLLLAGCTGGGARHKASGSQALPSGAVDATTSQVGRVRSSCHMTKPTTAKPPDPNTAAWSRAWYRSSDGAIWASQEQFYAGDNKVLWAKPATAGLRVSGRRLDGPAPPLVVDLPDGYEGLPYQASGLDFPTAGCWQVEATAGASSLRFVTLVYPRIYQPPPESCPDFASTVRQADGVFVGKVEGAFPDRPGFWWATVHVEQVLTAHAQGLLRDDRIPGRRLDILIGPDTPTGTLRVGGRYLLFVVADPGLAPRLLCGTFAKVAGDQVVVAFPGQQLGWSGKTVRAVEREVKAADG